MKRPRFLLVGAIAVILLGLLAACGGEDDDSTTPAAGDQPSAAVATATSAPDPEPTKEDVATEPPADPTATEDESSSEPEPTATEDAAEVEDEPTATVATDDDRIVGSASVDDDTEDVSNILMQEPDEPMPGIDLAHVSLEADGEQIVVTIETVGNIADELSEDVEVSFDVHLWQDGRPAYALSFHHDGSDDWEASITDFSVGLGDEETINTTIEQTGNTLTAAFPISMLEELESSFEWYSSVILSEGGMMIGPGAWFDGAPDNVIALLADPDEFVEFPQ